MTDQEWLAERFEENRPHLHAVAYRVLGSTGEADDAVQEAWLRLRRSGGDDVRNLGGWLTTVVARVCLNMLRSRASRREQPLPEDGADLAGSGPPGPSVSAAAEAAATSPEEQALLADSVGLALLVVLDTLGPAERLAFVLHDMFDLPFTEIAPIVGKSPAATRQLASRARRRVQGKAALPDTGLGRQREIVDAFLTASRGGDLQALVTLLDPDVVLRADGAAVHVGAVPVLHGAGSVAEAFSTRATGARLALINGAAGAVWAVDGTPRAVFGFTITDGRITAIDILADRAVIDQLDVVLLAT